MKTKPNVRHKVSETENQYIERFMTLSCLKIGAIAGGLDFVSALFYTGDPTYAWSNAAYTFVLASLASAAILGFALFDVKKYFKKEKTFVRAHLSRYKDKTGKTRYRRVRGYERKGVI